MAYKYFLLATTTENLSYFLKNYYKSKKTKTSTKTSTKTTPTYIAYDLLKEELPVYNGYKWHLETSEFLIPDYLPKIRKMWIVV